MVNITLPNREERLELLGERIKNLSIYFEIGDDVCPVQIAEFTKNFTEDELCRLTIIFLENSRDSRKTQGGTRNVELNGRRANLSVSSHPESVEEAAGCSIMNTEISDIAQFEKEYIAELAERGFIQMPPDQGLFSQLIEGAPKSGKSAIAAHFAQKSDVPFVKVILPEDFLEARQAEKCRHIRELFEDACVSHDSIVILDDLERLLEYSALDRSYSNEVLQTLMVLLMKQPPRGHRLHILCTSSRRDILEDLGMLSVFTSVIHVPNLFDPDQILSVAEASQRFEKEELLAIEAAIVDKPISIGIKRLLDLINWVNPLKPDRRVPKFLEKMGAEMGWE
ncbi:vesicle-fusing ATPase 2 isoform X2 [Drosophila serrata]|uniref:vesicle-fusing ATPase 2 isoform X2 n=1 Tax=Drosophila serrata TaxID=7274 RepID=UPI000A1D279D|nr:vesicle-fusing ATPase 2 isoform X2 [Drosophila serrata]